MLYLIGLGLNENGISKEGLLALERSKKVYLEGYTVDFPYKMRDLKLGKKKIVRLSRREVESDKLIKEAKSTKVALLVYGSPLFATTHMTLISDAQKMGVRTRVIYSASIFDAIAGTGLQQYKFGKTTSLPTQEADFLGYVKENQSIQAHSLILVDIGMDYEEALERLEYQSKKEKVKIDKIVVCSRAGTEKSQILYGKIDKLKDFEVRRPFCFIIPSKMHFMEEEALNRFKPDE